MKANFIHCAFLAAGLNLFILICFANAGDHALDKQEKKDGGAARTVQYSFTIQNTTNRMMDAAQFLAYAPVQHTSLQDVVSVESSGGHELIIDPLGNQILRFQYVNLPPYASSTILIKVKLKMYDTPRQVKSDNRLCLLPDKFIESDHPKIKFLAEKLAAKTRKDTVWNLFNWVSGNIQYEGYSGFDRGALYALTGKKGDCTEFAYLLVALCRASGVPARVVGGYICPENSVLAAEKYHNWAEVYLDGAWHIADPQKKIFMKNQSDYIAMRVIEHNHENVMGVYHRFRVDGKGLKVTMK